MDVEEEGSRRLYNQMEGNKNEKKIIFSFSFGNMLRSTSWVLFSLALMLEEVLVGGCKYTTTKIIPSLQQDFLRMTLQ